MAVTIGFAVVIVIGFIAGIRLMQSPRSALWGNRLGALSMIAAITLTFIQTGQGSAATVLICLAAGAIIGLILGQAVKMIHMPQTVALLNGLGGAASALVVWGAIIGYRGEGSPMLFWGTGGLAIGIGALTFSGSIIAVMKLQGLAFRKAIQFRGHGHFLRFTILLAALLIVINMSNQALHFGLLIPLVLLFSLLAGCLMTLRIGGADMPIVISLLNSFSGIAAAIAGLAVENLILAGTGALVGVAGMILTRIMCQAMNRSLLAVLTGFIPGAKTTATIPGIEHDSADTEADQTAQEDKEVHIAGEKDRQADSAEQLSETALPELLKSAARIIVVPGYGMAVAQAQLAVKQLVDNLEEQGKEVKFAIHPVAGRMPGHMNVLLAEAGVDYDKLLDIDTVNPQFAHADLVIVVGACDVINPAANAAEGTPISGMPILDAEKAKNIIICNMDENPGYSGVENLLYNKANVLTIWGDAAETIPRLTASLQA